jgi:Flp pilus assembly protein TadD
MPADPQQRTPDHDATVRYVFGYALSSIGRNRNAEMQLRQGLDLEGVAKGYRYLLLLELGVVRVKQYDLAEAMRLTKEAMRLVSHHSCAWYLLATICRRRGGIGFMKSFFALWRARYLQIKASGRAALPHNLFLAEGV